AFSKSEHQRSKQDGRINVEQEKGLRSDERKGGNQRLASFGDGEIEANSVAGECAKTDIHKRTGGRNAKPNGTTHVELPRQEARTQNEELRESQDHSANQRPDSGIPDAPSNG